jgi:hypothetical protein
MGGSPVEVGAVVGRVAVVRRYPVKSMAAEVVASAEVSWLGVAGDRRWGFVHQPATRFFDTLGSDTWSEPRTGPTSAGTMGPGSTGSHRSTARLA